MKVMKQDDIQGDNAGGAGSVCTRVRILFLRIEKFGGLHSQFTPPCFMIEARMFKMSSYDL